MCSLLFSLIPSPASAWCSPSTCTPPVPLFPEPPCIRSQTSFPLSCLGRSFWVTYHSLHPHRTPKRHSLSFLRSEKPLQLPWKTAVYPSLPWIPPWCTWRTFHLPMDTLLPRSASFLPLQPLSCSSLSPPRHHPHPHIAWSAHVQSTRLETLWWLHRRCQSCQWSSLVRWSG